jgi:hypothetical protein
MPLDAVAGLVTIITAPIAVAGVVLVWLQLRRMQADATSAERRRAAAVLPLLDVLGSHIEGDWSCEIIDRPAPVPDDQSLANITTSVMADLRLAEDLRSRCADAGLRQVVLASMIETDLRICGFYLTSVQRSTDRNGQWELRWPQLVKALHRLWETVRLLEASLSPHVLEIAPADRRLYRTQLSEQLNAAVKERVGRSLEERRIQWPPHQPLIPTDAGLALPNRAMELTKRGPSNSLG